MEVTQEKWTEITVTVDTKDIETAGNIANMVVPYGIYIEDYSALEEETMEIAHIDLIEASLLQKDRTKGIIHIYISPEENPAEAVSFLEERLQSAGIAYTLGTDLCALTRSAPSCTNASCNKSLGGTARPCAAGCTAPCAIRRM